jgi:hypothetical protein
MKPTAMTSIAIVLSAFITQVVDFNGGRSRIRTCDFHRVKVALYR